MFRFRSSIMILDRFQARVTGNPSVACTLWLFNIAMEAMAHRNRWFTWVYLLKLVIFHGYVQYNIYICIYIYILVGGFSHLEKYESQMGVLFPIYGKITNVPNQMVISSTSLSLRMFFGPASDSRTTNETRSPTFRFMGTWQGLTTQKTFFGARPSAERRRIGSQLRTRWLSISRMTRPGKPTFT